MTSVNLATKLSSLQLTNVFVGRVDLQKKEDVGPLPTGARIRWRLQHRVAYRLSAPNELRIKLDAKVVFREGSPEPFSLEVSIVGVYRSSDPIDERAVPDYLQTHSVPLLWPYLREVISDLTARTGGPTLILPTLWVGVSERHEEHDSSEGGTPGSKPADEPTAAPTGGITPPLPARQRRKVIKES